MPNTPSKQDIIETGCAVKVLRNHGPLNGMLGEVLDVLPNGNVKVRVAAITRDVRNQFITTVTTFYEKPENLQLDREATAKLKKHKDD